ncbi:MAG: hypothetical protein LBR27_04825 [Bifidobacteriaceae bacterium]|jgi:hypothetical protein|nr:hypothetical protein [Bifidobacteriaceae bacterium]
MMRRLTARLAGTAAVAVCAALTGGLAGCSGKTPTSLSTIRYGEQILLAPGEVVQLDASEGCPGGATDWSLASPYGEEGLDQNDALQVSADGQVTALNLGGATVLAKGDGCEAVMRFNIIVEEAATPSPGPVGEVWVKQANLSEEPVTEVIMDTTASVALMAVVAAADGSATVADPSVTWETADPSVAGVIADRSYAAFPGEYGSLRPKAAGETTVTVTAGEASTTIKVTVLEPAATGDEWLALWAIWADQSQPGRLASLSSLSPYSLTPADLATIGTAPAGKAVVIKTDTRADQPDAACLQVQGAGEVSTEGMALLPAERRPASLAEVEYVVEVQYASQPGPEYAVTGRATPIKSWETGVRTVIKSAATGEELLEVAQVDPPANPTSATCGGSSGLGAACDAGVYCGRTPDGRVDQAVAALATLP